MGPVHRRFPLGGPPCADETDLILGPFGIDDQDEPASDGADRDESIFVIRAMSAAATIRAGASLDRTAVPSEASSQPMAQRRPLLASLHIHARSWLWTNENTRQVFAGGMIFTMFVLGGYAVQKERARAESIRQDVARLREEMTAARSAGDRGEALRSLWAAAAPAASAEPSRSPAPAAAEVPRQKDAPRPPLEPAQMRDRMERSFNTERVDQSWAGTAQRTAHERIPGALPEGSEVRSVECRSTLCRIETSHVNREHYATFLHKAFLEPETRLWNGGQMSIMLDDASQAEGRFVVVSYLAKDGQAVPALE